MYYKLNLRHFDNIYLLIHSKQWFSIRDDLVSQETLGNAWDIFVSHNWELASSGQRPAMLPTSYTAQDTTENYLARNVNSAKVEKP